jgi:hypothetical protein
MTLHQLGPSIIFIMFIWMIAANEAADVEELFPIQKIVFGSCNKHDTHNYLFKKIAEENADVFIWLGDIIYADTMKLPFVWVFYYIFRLLKNY